MLVSPGNVAILRHRSGTAATQHICRQTGPALPCRAACAEGSVNIAAQHLPQYNNVLAVAAGNTPKFPSFIVLTAPDRDGLMCSLWEMYHLHLSKE
jgi:hypothetical protein